MAAGFGKMKLGMRVVTREEKEAREKKEREEALKREQEEKNDGKRQG